MSSQEQMSGHLVLEGLKLEIVDRGIYGGPQYYTITDATLKLLTDAKNRGDKLIMDSDCSVTFGPVKDE